MQTDWDEIHQERWKVCLFISFTSLGRLKGAGGSLLQRLEVVPNGISALQTLATHNNLKNISLAWRYGKETGICWLNQGI